MKSKPKSLLVTSIIDPETVKYTNFKKWGGNESLGIRPFQVREVIDSRVQNHLEGITKGRLKRLFTNPNAINHAVFFYPNDIETYLKSSGRRFKRYPIDHYTDKPQQDYTDKFANLFFCFVDYDPPKDSEDLKVASRKKFLDKAKSFELPPDVIVDSGNGYHAYWAISPIHVLRSYDQDEHPALIKFKQIQRALSEYFEADSTSATGKPRMLRIPGTWNVKVGRSRLCQYEVGDLLTAKSNPKYKLDDLFRHLKGIGLIKPYKRALKRRRPKPNFDGWRDALTLVRGHFKLPRVSEQFKRSFKFYYGHLKLQQDCVLEGEFNRKHLGTNGSQIKIARDQFIAMGLIQIISPPDYLRKKARILGFNDLFFNLCKIQRLGKKVSNEKRQMVINEVLQSDCPAGERRKLLTMKLNTLILQGGIRNKETLSSILCQWIHNRPTGLPRDTGEVNYLIEKNKYLCKDKDENQDG